MTEDLYSNLGVDREAGPGEIRKAYQRRAARSHPDKGGTSEEFQKVQHAYAVLKSPERRARYDAGQGDAVEDSAQVLLQQAMSIIVRIVESAPDIEATALIVQAQKIVAEGRQAIITQITQLRAKAKRYDLAVKRIHRKGEGENLIAKGLEGMAASFRTRVEGGGRALKMNDELRLFFENYEYEAKIATAPGSWTQVNSPEDLLRRHYAPYFGAWR